MAVDAAPDFMAWTWEDIGPQYDALEAMPLDTEHLDAFLLTWSELSERVEEIGNRLYVLTTRDTASENAAQRFHRYLDELYPRIAEAEQRIKEKLLASGLEPEGFELPLRKMRSDVQLFRAENLPLLSEEARLNEEYNQIIGAQTVQWEGRELPLPQVQPLLRDPDRDIRERVWRAIAGRRLQDRDALNELWRRMLELRLRIAANAGFADYRSYAWAQLKRYDYTPEDVQQFHHSVAEVVVPVVARILERRRERLGLDRLRPWDLDVDPCNRPALHPFADGAELEAGMSRIFHRVDPQLGEYFDTMKREGLLDLENRKNKAPGGYCSSFPASRRPFIFANLVGQRGDVEVMMHEGGHAFHIFEAANHRYYAQRNAFDIGAEFSEVGSMAMEFLAAPYLEREEGGFYSTDDAARARVEHLEQRVLMLWARLSAFDAFQHWVYQHTDEAKDPEICDARCAELQRRYVPVVDWTGLEAELGSGWHAILHLFVVPFYMIEYCLALLGAVQIWANAQQDSVQALRLYRSALALGNTLPIPDLFAAAGTRFAFDRATLSNAVTLVDETIRDLDPD